MSVGSQVHASMQNFSPCRRITYDARSRQAVARLVRKTRAEVMHERVPGITLDGSEGSMNRLADSISLSSCLSATITRPIYITWTSMSCVRQTSIQQWQPVHDPYHYASPPQHGACKDVWVAGPGSFRRRVQLVRKGKCTDWL